MILESDSDILDCAGGRNIIVVPADCTGNTEAGLVKKLCGRFPEWEKRFTEYCSLHADYPFGIIGKVFSYPVSEKTVICVVFSRPDTDKRRVFTDYDLWDNAFRKIAGEIQEENARKNARWTAHIQYGADCVRPERDWRGMRDIIESVFGGIGTDICIHGEFSKR